MVDQLNKIIDDIVQYGIYTSVSKADNPAMLERSLVALYGLTLTMPAFEDDNDYPEFDRNIPNLRKNIVSHFPGFGYYKVVINVNDLAKWDDIGTADAIDDLHDVIVALLEVKWRLQNNSQADGLWYFSHIFTSHIKGHLLGLLTYMSETR